VPLPLAMSLVPMTVFRGYFFCPVNLYIGFREAPTEAAMTPRSLE
jgi:hypothetical protein